MRRPLNEDVRYRAARPEDAPSIAELMMQLGYDVPADVVRERIYSLHSTHEVLVAILDSCVVGWLAVSLQDAFVTGRDVLIEGFVIAEQHRSRGIGATLLSMADDWCRQQGCGAIRVQTNVRRERAHRFYERNGYELLKTQHQFVRFLG